MRKLLLATAALALAGAGVAFASGSAQVTINSSLDASCSVSDATTTLTLSGTVAQTGHFTTTCNFSAADLHVQFQSDKGGVYNSVENVTAPYTLTYNAGAHDSSTLTGAGVTIDHASGSTSPVIRDYDVALNAPLSVAGSYADTLTITVTP